jgi:D-alanyl-D-alanine carboxypeptidase-like protein/putative peptidoglycan binding protein
MQVLRRGGEGTDVRQWQHFLLGLGLLKTGVDGVFGLVTERATCAFQKAHGLTVDGAVGPLTYAAALQLGFDPGISDPLGGTSGQDWPPRPIFSPLISNGERAKVFGAFEYERVSPRGDAIRILGNWRSKNIGEVVLPQLARVRGGPRDGKVHFHRKVAEQVRALFDAWEQAGLIGELLTWDGAFVPRFVRGSATTLSNHAWGTAFDVNFRWNQRGTVPALRDHEGSVRELVPIANLYGFYWGGHFSRRDGMHFELAQALG